MKLTRLLPLLFPLLFIACFVAPTYGSSLRAVVSLVPDGQTIVVNAGPNRKLTVVLAGVAAPELKQQFGDVAQKHLESLVLNKQVEVELSHLRTLSVVGKVYCNRADVGLQIIRDGAAWYDESTNQDLSELERRLYDEAQVLARFELRGLWQAGKPIPPWEWRRAQDARSVNTQTSNPRWPKLGG